MEKEHKLRLQRLWLKLLENVSDYDGVIGGMFAEGILTPGMKERIMQKKGTDRMRELLDILPRRGDKAFHTFYEVLVDRGEDIAADLLCPELAAQRKSNAAQRTIISGVPESIQDTPAALTEEDELPAKWPDHSSHNPFQVNVTKIREADRDMRALFDKTIVGTGTVYAMYKATRGIFVLISNEHFKVARSNGEDLADRDGTAKDTMALSDLFEQLDFRVVVKVNLTAEEMLEAVKSQAERVEPTDNCFACAVLTHGERGTVYGVDGNKIELDELKAVLVDKCPLLVGKPKIFFIQACQGKKYDNSAAGGDEALSNIKVTEDDKDIREIAEKFVGITLRDTNRTDASSDGTVSSKSDVFVAMATIADYVSWRNTNWGTWFVQAVVYIFSRFAHKYEINQLMTRVNKLISRAETSKGYKQVSIYNSSLTSDLYFFPGLHHCIVESHSEVDIAISKVQSQDTPLQSASVELRQPTIATQPTTESGSITAQVSDNVDGGQSVLVE